MLPKNKRLTTTIHKKIFESGKNVFGTTISLVYIRENPSLPTRFGFSVSKKVGKTAPKRNTMRRKGYAALQKLSDKILPGFCVVFIIKKDINKEPLLFFIQTMEELIKKSPLFNN